MNLGENGRAMFLAAIAAASAYGCEERAGDLPILEQAPMAELHGLPLTAPTPHAAPPVGSVPSLSAGFKSATSAPT